MIELRTVVSDDLLERVAERAAELVVERLHAENGRGESAFLNVEESAELLRSKPQRVYDLVSAGVLRRHKDGARLLVERSELLAYLRESR